MKYSILFMVDNRGKLRMVVRYKMKRMFYNLSFSVDKEKWNTETQRCKRNTTHGESCTPAAKINKTIQRYEDAVNMIANNYEEKPTFEVFKKDLDKVLKREHKENETEKGKTFEELYKEYIEEQKSQCGWSKSLVYKQKQVLREWIDFDENISVEKINAEKLKGFTSYLISQGYQNETTNKKISLSKWFFRWLVSKNIITDISFTATKTHLKRANRNVVFLTWDELINVYSHPFPQGGYLDRVRDVFCFCCFSSLRYSDVYSLRKSDIYNDAIHIVTKKTNDKITIELNDYTKEILCKYKNIKGEKALPVISNQKMNEYLKEVCRECELTEKLTDIYYIGNERHEVTKEKWQMVGTHSGRRTFICNALMLGIAPNVVMKWTGHADYKSMQPYIDIADKAKQKAMTLFNKKSDKL